MCYGSKRAVIQSQVHKVGLLDNNSLQENYDLFLIASQVPYILVNHKTSRQSSLDPYLVSTNQNQITINGPRGLEGYFLV
jgi:hypothetical protein